MIRANPADAAATPTLNDLGFQDGQHAVAGTIFVRNASLSGSIQLSASGINASAQLGFLGLGVANGQGTAVANVLLQLTDPGTDRADGRIDLEELKGALNGAAVIAARRAPANGQLSGDAHFTLTLGSVTSPTITVPRNASNLSLDDLVAAINTALANAGLGGAVVASQSNGFVRLVTKGLGSASSPPQQLQEYALLPCAMFSCSNSTPSWKSATKPDTSKAVSLPSILSYSTFSSP